MKELHSFTYGHVRVYLSRYVYASLQKCQSKRRMLSQFLAQLNFDRCKCELQHMKFHSEQSTCDVVMKWSIPKWTVLFWLGIKTLTMLFSSWTCCTLLELQWSMFNILILVSFSTEFFYWIFWDYQIVDDVFLLKASVLVVEMYQLR